MADEGYSPNDQDDGDDGDDGDEGYRSQPSIHQARYVSRIAPAVLAFQ